MTRKHRRQKKFYKQQQPSQQQNQPPQQSYIGRLSPEVLVDILRFVGNGRVAVGVAIVCKEWARVIQFIMNTTPYFMFQSDINFATFLFRRIPNVPSHSTTCTKIILGYHINISPPYIRLLADSLPALVTMAFFFPNFNNGDSWCELFGKPKSVLVTGEIEQLDDDHFASISVLEALQYAKTKCPNLVSLALRNAKYVDERTIWRLIEDEQIQALDLRGADVNLQRLNLLITTSTSICHTHLFYAGKRCRKVLVGESVKTFVKAKFVQAFHDSDKEYVEGFKNEWDPDNEIHD